MSSSSSSSDCAKCQRTPLACSCPREYRCSFDRGAHRVIASSLKRVYVRDGKTGVFRVCGTVIPTGNHPAGSSTDYDEDVPVHENHHDGSSTDSDSDSEEQPPLTIMDILRKANAGDLNFGHLTSRFLDDLAHGEYEDVEVDVSDDKQPSASKINRTGSSGGSGSSGTKKRIVRCLKHKLYPLIGDVQAGKSKAMLDLSLTQILVNKGSSVIFVRQNNDAFQLRENIMAFIQGLKNYCNTQDIPIPDELDSFEPFMMCDDKEKMTPEFMVQALQGKPKLIIALGNDPQISPIKKAFESPKIPSRIKESFILFIDESDFVDSQNQSSDKNAVIEIMKKYATMVYLVTATPIDNLINEKRILPKNVTRIIPSSSYRGIIDFSIVCTSHTKNSPCYIHRGNHPHDKSCEFDGTDYESKFCTQVAQNLLETDEALGDLVARWSSLGVISVRGFDAHHPRIMLVTVGNTKEPQHKLVKDLQAKYPDMAFIVDNGDGIFLTHQSLSQTKPIHIKTNIVNVKSSIKNGRHVFNGCSVGPILQYLRLNGGSKVFHHILIASGNKAGRSVSYVCSSRDGSETPTGEMPHWHLTEHRLVLPKTAAEPNVLQKCRLATTLRDSIPLTLYVSDVDGESVIKAYWKLEEAKKLCSVNRIDTTTHDLLQAMKFDHRKFTKHSMCCHMSDPTKAIMYRRNGVNGPDGGMSIDEYGFKETVELKRQVMAEQASISSSPADYTGPAIPSSNIDLALDWYLVNGSKLGGQKADIYNAILPLLTSNPNKEFERSDLFEIIRLATHYADSSVRGDLTHMYQKFSQKFVAGNVGVIMRKCNTTTRIYVAYKN